MCMEDIRIGGRRWNRVTLVTAGTPAVLPANSTRVVLRINHVNGDSTGLTRSTGTVTRLGANASILSVGAGQDTDEIWVERHGQLVYEAITITALGGLCTVIEVFQDDQQNAPGPPVFPGVGIRGPISTATP